MPFRENNSPCHSLENTQIYLNFNFIMKSFINFIRRQGAIILFFIVLGVGIYFFINQQSDPLVVCPIDTKICPDESSVDRVSPNCDFAKCLGTE